MKTGALAIAAALCLGASLSAQPVSSEASRAKALAEATRFGNAGQLTAARVIVDSVMKTIPADAPDFDEVLFTRATVAASVLDARLDYEKIIESMPSSRRRKESLLRVAQQAYVAGETARALGYLQTLTRDYTDDSSRATAEYWRRRISLDAGMPVADSQPTRIPAKVLLPPPGVPVGKSGAMFAVQVAAFAQRKDADAMAERLRKTGLDAHVDGTTRPFRVRIGRYPTKTDAVKALNDLKSRQISGFVTQLTQ